MIMERIVKGGHTMDCHKCNKPYTKVNQCLPDLCPDCIADFNEETMEYERQRMDRGYNPIGEEKV